MLRNLSLVSQIAKKITYVIISVFSVIVESWWVWWCVCPSHKWMIVMMPYARSNHFRLWIGLEHWVEVGFLIYILSICVQNQLKGYFKGLLKVIRIVMKQVDSIFAKDQTYFVPVLLHFDQNLKILSIILFIALVFIRSKKYFKV